MAAGNWLTTAGLGDSLIAVGAKTIQVALHESIKNQEAVGHPVIQGMIARDIGLGPLLGALGAGFSFADLGQGKFSAIAEGTEASATNFDEAGVTITPARRAFARKASDFARSLQEPLLTGEISPDAYALIVYEAYRIWSNDLIDQIAALAPSASNVIGTTGTALTWAAVKDGAYDMKDRGASGRAMALISKKGIKDLSDDGLSLGGAVQMAQQMQQFVPNAVSGAFCGNFFGVDFFLCGELDASGGDTFGLILTDGAVGSKHQNVPLPAEATALMNNNPMFTIEMRRPGGGITTFETVTHRAVAALEQGRMAALQYAT